VLEPGLDMHEWESQWQQLEEDLEATPAETLPEVDRLIAEMLEGRGYDLNDPVVREGEGREIVAEYQAAREITRAVDQGKDVEAADIQEAVEHYRALHDYLIAERPAP
jgi:hypothetical protein